MVRASLLMCGTLVLFTAGCGREDAKPALSTAEKPHVEADLTRTTISLEAFQKLKIATARASQEAARVRRPCTGYVIPQSLEQLNITAPVAGMVQPGKAFPLPGERLKAGQAIVLQPVLTPLEMVQTAMLRRDVEAEFKKAREKQAVADSEVKRLRELVEQGLRGKQELEEAVARQQQAKEDVQAAEFKLGLFHKGKSLELTPVSVELPADRTVLAVHVSPGQYVPAGAPLATVASLADPWLRVFVPEADLETVDRAAPLEIVFPPTRPGEKQAVALASPLPAVPEVDPVKHTAELLYQLKVPEGRTVARNQMFEVDVPLRQATKETVLPYSALIFDAHGGTWIYVQRSKKTDKQQVFQRLRVELGPSLGKNIVVRPPLGAEEVVVEGAGVLFSREFHRPPVAHAAKAEVEDDD